MDVIWEPALGSRFEAFRQRDGVGLAALNLLQIEARLVGVGQVLAVGRDHGTRDRRVFRISGQRSFGYVGLSGSGTPERHTTRQHAQSGAREVAIFVRQINQQCHDRKCGDRYSRVQLPVPLNSRRSNDRRLGPRIRAEKSERRNVQPLRASGFRHPFHRNDETVSDFG